MSYDEAADYVRTTPASGAAQFELACMVGLEADDYVLEVGCGALHFARVAVAFLDAGHYCGIDPNEWLRIAAREHDPTLGPLCAERGARFETRDDFDGRGFGKSFDLVFAHSVLSHVSLAQLRQFLVATRRVLAPGGTVLASLNLGSHDTATDSWSYPLGVHFRRDTFDFVASVCGFDWVERVDLRSHYVERCPSEPHDWVELCARHS